MRLVHVAALAVVASVGACAPAHSAPPSDLVSVPGMKEDEWHGIGGLVVENPDDADPSFLVVHDNKDERKGDKKHEDRPRVGRIVVKDGTPTYVGLVWPPEGELPWDAEALSAVPDEPGCYALVGSKGPGVVFRVGGDKIAIVGSFALPGKPDKHDFESFSLRKLKGVVAAVWADRGGGDRGTASAATLFWGTFEKTKTSQGDTAYALNPVGETPPFELPFLVGANTREVSDLKLDADGNVWATAARDDGSSFEGFSYLLGTLRDPESTGGFTPASPPKPSRPFPKHKVEAIEFVSGKRMAYGADDEGRGGRFLLE
jgi:hypothetical protein